MKNWETLQDMYSSDEYDRYIGDKLGNDLFINDPDRAERIYDAAEYGTDGSTHAETIEDWREFLGQQKCFDPEYDDPDDIDRYDITLSTYNAISAEIDECEQWHVKNGSINQQKG